MKMTARELVKRGAIVRINEIKAEIKELREEISSLEHFGNGEVYRQKKKTHWTQTPEGRKRMSQIAKNQWTSEVKDTKRA